jgi:hypothetical protein
MVAYTVTPAVIIALSFKTRVTSVGPGAKLPKLEMGFSPSK